MIKRTLGCVALFGWLLAASAPLQAHHSLAGVYDMKKDTELSGTVTSVKFTNPHGSLALAVKKNRRECAPQRGQHQGKIPAREGRQSVGVSRDGDDA